MKIKNYLLLTLLILTTTSALGDVQWTDVSRRFLQNTDFDNGNSDGWTINSNAGQRAVSAKVMRFWNGTFDFSQQLSHLPKGLYRLSVQGFYRSQGDSYQAYKNGTDEVTAFLYADVKSTPLVNIYSESMTSNVGNRQEHDGRYYPDNSTSAAAAFEEGLYKGNSIEFEAEGNVTIGVRCQQAGTNNYCAFDNFKLEYATAIDGKAWVDVTSLYLTNTGFTGGSDSGWTWKKWGGSCNLRCDCMEFWNTTFDISQQVSNASPGHYRLSVQSYYRTEDNNQAYYDYVNGSANITGFLYAGDNQQPLRSVYSESMYSYVDGAWSNGGRYYPNTMESARVFFDNDCYWNVMEFDGEGTFNIGLRCFENKYSSWCIFDNFKLEYFTDIVTAQSITISVPMTELVISETMTATATVLPLTATLPFVDWSSSNEQVLTIDKDGFITAVGEGTATITATAYDGSGVKESVSITVIRNQAVPGSFVINEIMPSNVDEFMSPAFNFDGWVELYNPTNRAVELGGITVSDPADATTAWKIPQAAGVIPAKGYKVVWFDSNDECSTNVPFKLDTDGGEVVFRAPNGQTIASQDYPLALERVSYARSADGGSTWGYCDTPTPGATNNGTTLLREQLDAPVVDKPSQFFTGSLPIKVTIPSGCTLRFTTDGSLPTLTNGETSSNGRFVVENTSSYRFRLFGAGKLPSRVTTRSYIYKDKDYYLPVISVVTDEDFLYDTEIGLFEKGPNGRPGRGQDDNCNWNRNWERPVNFSFLTADGEMALNQDVNLEMCGGWSRAWTPHSFKLKGTKEMGGDKNLPYPFFEQKPYIRNRTLQIRNGGNDTSARIKDASLQVILSSSGIDVDYQSYQPIHEFINGKYMGVLNMREPNNKHYVYANYGWDDDEIDAFEMSPDSGYVQTCGTADAFNDLVHVLSPNAANARTYEEICRMLDIDAYINYMAMELYLGGTDFPQNNVKGFRHKVDGRFRFVTFDLDHAFYTDDPFKEFLKKEDYWFDKLKPSSLGQVHDSIAFVTLFKNLLQNDNFRRRFVDAFCIMGGSVFEKGRSIAVLNELYDRVRPAMNMENKGWNLNDTYNNLKNSLNNRLNTAIQSLRNCDLFNLYNTEPQQVILRNDTYGSRIFINGQVVPTGFFDGMLFGPVTLRAEAPAGYEFKSWVQNSGSELSTRPEITMPNGAVGLTATFRQLTVAEKQKQGINPVRINEVSGANDSYIDEYSKKGDWVELYNTTSDPIDVEGMYLTDNAEKPTKYKITKGNTRAQTVIPAYGYLVIWCDNKRATTDNGLHANFKISDDGGLVMLSASDLRWADVLNYSAHDARTTVGRYPDGTASVYAMNVATIGKSNVMSSYVTAVEQTSVPTEPTGLMAVTATDLRLVYGSGMLLAKNSQNGPVTVEVFRGDGVQVLQTIANIQNGTARVSVADLPTGFYVARVTTENGVGASCRFVK